MNFIDWIDYSVVMILPLPFRFTDQAKSSLFHIFEGFGAQKFEAARTDVIFLEILFQFHQLFLNIAGYAGGEDTQCRPDKRYDG